MSNKNIKRTAPILGVLAASLAFSPMLAFAGTLNVSQKGFEGANNPASTIIVKDASGNVVKEVSYNGGSETIDPITLDAGEYEVSAKADGYVFNVQRGAVADDAPTNAELIAKKAANLNIEFKAEGVSDFSGIKVQLFEGENAQGQPKAEATTNNVGKLTFEQVPSGKYLLKFTYPSAIASKVSLPEEHKLNFDAQDANAANITIGKDGGANKEAQKQVGVVPIKIVDAKDKAVKDVEVSIFEKGQSSAVVSGKTDKDGKFSVKDLKDNTEYVVKLDKLPNGLKASAEEAGHFTFKKSEENAEVKIKLEGEIAKDKKKLNQTGEVGQVAVAVAGAAAIAGTAAGVVAMRRRQMN